MMNFTETESNQNSPKVARSSFTLQEDQVTRVNKRIKVLVLPNCTVWGGLTRGGSHFCHCPSAYFVIVRNLIFLIDEKSS